MLHGLMTGSYDNKAALRMVKDMKNEMERARSSLDYSDNRRNNLGKFSAYHFYSYPFIYKRTIFHGSHLVGYRQTMFKIL